MLGLLAAAYEMNTFKEEYQKKVITNAKAFARALKECGMKVAGDPTIEFTETHQVIVNVGYGRGPESAKRLEDSNIICNYQAMPDEEGFTASGALRMGVSEMTRFGMGADDFRELAVLISDAVVKKVCVIDQVRRLRERFCDLQYCFKGEEVADVLHRMREMF
jgi:aminomethyltransferase